MTAMMSSSSTCRSSVILAVNESDVRRLKMQNVNLSVCALEPRENATVSDAYLQTEVRWDTPV